MMHGRLDVRQPTTPLLHAFRHPHDSHDTGLTHQHLHVQAHKVILEATVRLTLPLMSYPTALADGASAPACQNLDTRALAVASAGVIGLALYRSRTQIPLPLCPQLNWHTIMSRTFTRPYHVMGAT